MINNQILEFIKLEQQKNTARETIVKSLLSSGWNMEDINQAFASLSGTTTIPPIKPTQNVQFVQISNPWIKRISHINNVFLTLYVLALALLDYPTYISDVRHLQSFWEIMLGVFGTFLVFFVLESFVFKNSFKNSLSTMDSHLVTVIILRNLLVMLNLIPVIQLLGLGIGIFAGPIIALIYIGLIIARYVKKPPVQGQMVS